MTDSSPQEDPIAIVGMAATLPGASDIAGFWERLMGGESQLVPMPVSRWPQGLQGVDANAVTDYVAAVIGDKTLQELCAQWQIDAAEHNRLDILTLATFAQLAGQLDIPTLAKRRTQFCFGCMAPHEELVLASFASTWRDHINDDLDVPSRDEQRLFERFRRFTAQPTQPTSSVIARVKQRFGLTGEGCLIDAACASSLAAIGVGTQKLQSNLADLVFVGGLEADMLPYSFGSFELVGALSTGRCLPFDSEHAGLSQGEGVVLFALQRLEDAIQDGHHIWGVIRGIGSSSDGRGTSLFEPSADGQRRTYMRAYEGLGNNRVDFIEAHGTGTAVGDRTELQSLASFFDDLIVPMGSAKALVGHTRGAAGAVGLLKALLVMQHRVIPPSSYFRKFPKNVATGSLKINRRPITLRKRTTPLRVGVSAFGFGGANYHLVVDEYKAEQPGKHRHGDDAIVEPPKQTFAVSTDPIVIVGQGRATPKAVSAQEVANRFRIVPASMGKIDLVHQQSLIAVAEALDGARIDLDRIDRTRTSVISASMLGLQKRLDYFSWVSFTRLKELHRDNPDLLAHLQRRQQDLTQPSEDTSAGILNNVAAGRVSAHYDLGGKSFNVDSDTTSFPTALGIATGELRSGESNLVMLVWAEESFDAAGSSLMTRGDVHCWLLMREATAADNGLPILGVVQQIDYEEPKNG